MSNLNIKNNIPIFKRQHRYARSMVFSVKIFHRIRIFHSFEVIKMFRLIFKLASVVNMCMTIFTMLS